MCNLFFVLFRLVIYDDDDNNNNNNNFFDLEAFLQVPIHLQINEKSKKYKFIINYEGKNQIPHA